MMPMLADHLWQSTVFALAAGGLTLAFRRNRASVRFWLWLAASLKFLVPFAALVAIATQFAWQPPVTPAATVASAIGAISQPFSDVKVGLAPDPSMPGAPSPIIPFALFGVWLTGVCLVISTWSIRWRRVAAAVREGSSITHGRMLDILGTLERRNSVGAIVLVSSTSALEPGVFGIWKPILLWPQRMNERLDDQQVEAIMAHEVCHVRRRDNLLASLHMLVEAVFWFHPLVWWVGAGLVRERERACDEDVLRLGSEPGTYAEGILKTCEFCLSSPVPNVSGVSGADLKKRIEQIMTNVGAVNLSVWRRALLVILGVAAIVGPVAAGVVNAARLRVQTPKVGLAAQVAQTLAPSPVRPTFEVASVKPNKGGDNLVMIGNMPGGGLTMKNMALRGIITFAYQLQDFQLVDAPDWIANERFDIMAKASTDGSATEARAAQEAQTRLMMQSLLEDRFKLTAHRDQRPMSIYNLMLARADGKPGPQLRPSSNECGPNRGGGRGDARGGPPPGPPAPPAPGERPACGMMMSPGRIIAGGTPFSQLISPLSNFTRRIVVDRTNLSGSFDIDLVWTPDQMPSGAPAGVTIPAIDPNGPSIFTALQEQLGLKLESQTSPVDVLVIDRVERPTPD